MAYTPINWQTGDTITAAKLNRCDNGWSVESTQLFSETVTTVAGQYGNSAQLAFLFEQEPPATVVITFDGTDYTVERNDQYSYGDASSTGLDFSTYPFYVRTGSSTVLYTATAGTHTIALSERTLEVSADFGAAVASAAEPLNIYAAPTTYQECVDAFMAKREVMYIETNASQVTKKYWMAAFDDANLRVYFAYLDNANTGISITFKTVTSPDDIIY